MAEVLVDSETQQRLNGLTELTVFRGEDGAILGCFHPTVQRKVCAEGEVPELPEEEIQRRMAEPGGRTWDEIKRDLERLR